MKNLSTKLFIFLGLSVFLTPFSVHSANIFKKLKEKGEGLLEKGKGVAQDIKEAVVTEELKKPDWSKYTVPTPKNNSLRILTLNVALLTKKLGVISTGIGDNRKRAERIAKKILQNVDKFDVIFFQEAFDTNALTQLANIIRNTFPYRIMDRRTGKFIVGMNSGLAIFSKYPIEKTIGPKDFTCFLGWEALARKGILGVKLNVPGLADGTVYAVNTHLQSGGGGVIFKKYVQRTRTVECPVGTDPQNTKQIAMAEMEQAYDWIKEFVGAKGDLAIFDAPVIFGGDFNIDYRPEREGAEYLNIAKAFPGVLNLYENDRPDFTKEGSAWDKEGKLEVGKIMDYVLVLNPESEYIDETTSTAQIVNIFDASDTDHLGVIGTINFYEQ